MEEERLYLGIVKNEDQDSSSYAIFHDFASKALGATCTRSGISRNHLIGYLDGATAGRWQRVALENGIPNRFLTEDAWGYQLERTVQPIDEPDLAEILREADIAEYYPRLAEPSNE